MRSEHSEKLFWFVAVRGRCVGASPTATIFETFGEDNAILSLVLLSLYYIYDLDAVATRSDLVLFLYFKKYDDDGGFFMLFVFLIMTVLLFYLMMMLFLLY